MQNVQEIQHKAFQDAQIIIERLSTINSVEDFISMKQEISCLYDLCAFLNGFNTYAVSELHENSDDNHELVETENSQLEDVQENYIAEEEVIFNNHLNEIDDSEIGYSEIHDPELEEEAIFNNELNEIDQNEFINIEETEETEQVESHELAHFEDVANEALQSTDNEEKSVVSIAENSTENRGKIVEFEKEKKEEQDNDTEEEFQQLSQEEKKIRLSNIKGLKKIQTLFDEDPLEELENSKPYQKEEHGNLLKTNIPTNFMEAEKPKHEFRLDLNDKIAFSKILFDGSQTDLNDAIRQLNEFKNLEEAKEYLSDLYYEKNWQKVDEYAQRLWSLVENKFL